MKFPKFQIITKIYIEMQTRNSYLYTMGKYIFHLTEECILPVYF